MKNIKSLAAALFLAGATVAGMAGCAGDRYHQSTGEHIDDSTTTMRVKSALGNDGMYKYPDVIVTTFKGTVQLSGFVDDRAQKGRAVSIVRDVQGVHEVQDNISVKH